MRKVAVVAAHPDDEILGCGATMARHARRGDDVRIFILGEGITSRYNRREDAAHSPLELLKLKSKKAARIVGAREVRFASLPDNRFDTVPLLDVVKTIEHVFDEWKPDIVYTHSMVDLNVDHRITAEAALTSLRPLPGRNPVRVLSFEVLSSTEWSARMQSFSPSVYVDVTKDFNKKIQALRCYHSEMRPFPHPRSYDGTRTLARLRGSQAGVKMAEAFTLLREVIKH